MCRVLVLAASLAFAGLGSAGVNKPFTDNGNVEVVLSKSNYNRILVTDDVIERGYFPAKTLAFKTVKDGSAYLDILKDEAVTLFIDTKGGHHFSLTVTPTDALGQTIVLTPESANKIRAAKFEKKLPYEETIAKLIHTAMNDSVPSGYGVKRGFHDVRTVHKNLSLTTKRQLVGNDFVVDVVQIKNKSTKSQPLYESWFSGNGVKAVAFNTSELPPKKTALMYVVRESRHV